MVQKLKEFGAIDIRDVFLKDNSKSDKPRGNDKIRFTFSIGTEEQALNCYNFILDYNSKNYQAQKKNKTHKPVAEEAKNTDEMVFDVVE
jgi:hypothetical protein